MANHVTAGRFIPTSELDFNRYAKHFAWLMALPLATAKKDLAQLYGFPSLHELQQVLKQGLPPGPFSAAPGIPSFIGEAPICSGEECLPLQHSVHVARNKQLWAQVFDATDIVRQRRAIALLEAGLFCQPKVHKALFARVEAGLTAFESKDPQVARAWLESNWPIGYWALLDWLYMPFPELDPEGLAQLTHIPKTSLPDVQESLWQFKATKIYQLVTQGVPATEVGLEWCTEMPEPRKTETAPGLFDFSLVSDFGDLPVGLEQFFGEKDGEAYLELCGALSQGDLDLSRHPCIRGACSDAELVALEQRLREIRYGQLRISCDINNENSRGLVEELLDHKRHWPLSDVCQEIAAHRRDAPDRRIPPELIAQRSHHNEWLVTYVSLSPTSEAHEYYGYHVQLLAMTAMSYHCRGEGDAAQYELVGGASGNLLVPYDQQYACSHEGWFEALDSTAMLNDVWKVLQVDHFPGQGLRSIEEFTADRPFKAIAVTNIELLPKYRGKGLVPSLLDSIYAAIDDRPYSMTDGAWYELAKVLAFEQDVVDELDPMPRPEGMRELGAPAVFVITVPGAAPDNPVNNPFLRSSLTRIRKDPHNPLERRKRKLMAHFKAMEAELALGRDDADAISIVCYDPQEWPTT